MSIRIGIIGCGNFMAVGHVGRLLSSTEVEIVALADTNPEAVERLRKKFPPLRKARAYRDHGSLLKRAAPEAVVIATPHTLHFQHITDALDAGCHVLVEKPMVTSVEHAREVIARRDAAGKVVLVSYQRHYLPHFRYVSEAIRAGELGEIQFVSGLQSQGWLRLTNGTWRQDPQLSGGGQLIDSGSHLLGFILHATGLAMGTVKAYASDLKAPVNINSALALRFANGAIGTIAVVGNSPHAFWEDVSFFGSKGAILTRTDRENGAMQPKIYRDAFGTGRVEVTDPGPGSTPDANFIDAVMGRDEVRSTAEDGMRVVQLTVAAQQSVESGREERVG